MQDDEAFLTIFAYSNGIALIPGYIAKSQEAQPYSFPVSNLAVQGYTVLKQSGSGRKVALLPPHQRQQKK
jgi:hypothetical protein